jgi:hypothetical protein
MKTGVRIQNSGENQSEQNSSQFLAFSPRLRLAVSPRRLAVPSNIDLRSLLSYLWVLAAASWFLTPEPGQSKSKELLFGMYV